MFTLTKSGSENLVTNQKGGDFTAPRVATTANGSFRVVWDANDYIGERPIGPTGAPSGAELISFDQGQRVFPLDGGGTFTLTGGGGSFAEYRMMTSAGNQVTSTLYINFPPSLGHFSSTTLSGVVTDGQGGALLLLRNVRGGPLEPTIDTSRVIHVDALGRQTELPVSGVGLELFALKGGGYAVVRAAGSNNAAPADVAVFDAKGVPLVAVPVAGVDVTGVALTGQGRVVVVSESGGDVFQQVFDANGAAVGARTLVNTAVAGVQTGSSVITLADGSYVVGWTDGDAWVRLFNPDGAPATDAVRVEGAGNGLEQFALVLEANPVGGFAAVWLEGAGGGGAPSLVKSQIFVTGQVGTAGADTLTGGPGGEKVEGGDGADRLALAAGDDFGLGQAGADTILTGDGADTLAGGAGDDVLDGGRGFDFADYRDSAAAVRADITALAATGEGADRLSQIEGVLGSAGGDTLVGNYLSNNLFGFAGDDVIEGMSANDYLDGGAGNDTVVLVGQTSDYFVRPNTDGTAALIGPFGTSTVFSVERVQIGGQTMTWTDFANQAFNSLRYVASNPSLIASLGTDAAAARQHWLSTGQAQGLSLTAFDPLRYAASNPDLMAQFGTNTEALTRHYITTGFAGGRSATSFDALQYGAINPDLLRAFGPDVSAMTRHYVVSGPAEGRPVSGFDPLLYGASNDDLARLFGNNSQALFDHWVRSGALEERPTTTFDGLMYAATNDDLARTFGTDARAAMNHYLTVGADEDRETTGFDAVAYLLSYGDLQERGIGPEGAFTHWLTVGADENRRGDEFFGREQEDHSIAIGRTIVGELDSYSVDGRLYADKDWYALTLRPGETAFVAVRGAEGGHGTLADPRLLVYDGRGVFMRELDNTGPSLDATFIFNSIPGGTFYLVVASRGTYGVDDGTYTLQVLTPPIGGAPADGWIA